MKIRGDLKINFRSTKKEVDDMVSLIEKLGKIEGVTAKILSKKRMCDGCDKVIKKGEKFKGSGMKEFCHECSAKNKIKGEWKVNEY